ncbi:hypothetical protein BLNAU_18605 [Blattamonas nauphoetae]|uniref:Protein kinase domain-containing protein n=1 Tax=Blattamonas nauphoetae TaxID=2049346 RepID=A0ABQ9X426_9EUKA|nr:hypothetical protein BLNAU_18605 [Blattamonas nauphoetae]
MPFLSLLSVLLTSATSHHQTHSPQLLPLQKLLPLQRNTAKVNELNTKSDIVLPHGRYHVSNFELTSTTLNLNGKQSLIFPSSTTNDEDFSEYSGSNGLADEMNNTSTQLFRISNSTIWMSSLRFECGSGGWSIARIWGSCVGIVGSVLKSNWERGPFVIVGGDCFRRSSVTIISSWHTSSCFPWLLPLTGVSGCDCWTGQNWEWWELGSEVLVTGSDVEVCDACLIGGSGALFDFSGLPLSTTDGCSITTTLASSSLLNTTSSSGRGSGSVGAKEEGCDFGTSESVSQKMIGSCVSWSTNHLCGTGIRDVNLGGSVLCSNTSFTHCTTTTTVYSNEHHTNRTQITTADTLHLFSLCTFKACSSSTSDSGGAISIAYVTADLEIASCSFELCSAGVVGADLYFIQSTVQSSVIISSSSFVKSSSKGKAVGSLYLRQMQTLSISDCVFLDSQKDWYGGAVYIYKWDAEISNTGLSNCLFEDCKTTWSSSTGGGGALCFENCSSIRLDSLRFRECVSATGRGHDLIFCFTYTIPTVSLSTVSNCDSTSTPKEKRIYPAGITEDDVLPTPTDTTTILSLKAQQTTSTTAEIVVTLDKEVTGWLLVLVSNSEGTDRTDTTKAPNIGRVLMFIIDESDIGRCTVSTGETGLLQLPLSDYKVVTSSFSEQVFPHPTFTSAKCVLDDSCTRAILKLEGFDVDGETFELTLQNGATLEATSTDSKAMIDLGVIGESSKWMENEVFVITSGKKKGDDSIVVSMPSPLYFTIPLAARLMNIVVSDLNDDKTEVTLSFSSRHLKGNSKYEVRIEKVIGSETEVMELMTNAEGQICEQTVTLHPSKSNTEGWKNWIGCGGRFKVVGVLWKRLEGDVAIQFSSILIDIPVEVVRVSSAKCSTDSVASTVVSIVGSGLISNETYTLTLSGTPTTDPDSLDVHNATICVVASSSTEAKSVPLLLSSTSGSSLLFGHTYRITGITNGSVAGIVVGTPSFTTHSTPTVKSLLCKLKEGDAKTAEISISGTDIPDGLYNLVVKNTVSTEETELPMKIVDSTGKVEIVVFSSSLLEYGAEYEVVGLSSSSLTVALPTSATDRSLKVPDAPARVRSASCVLAGERKTHMKVVIFGENLPVGKTLSVGVKEVGSTGSTIGSEIGLPSTGMATSTSTAGIEIEIFEVTNPGLDYGKTYELTSLTISETFPFILDDSVRFSVPCEPVRITFASCTRNETDWTVVSVEGSGFVLGEFYTVSVSGHPIGSLSPPPSSLHDMSFVVIASSSTKATSSALQLHPAEESDLKYLYSYKIVGITNGSVEGVVHSVVFETQSDITRDETQIRIIEVVPASSLNTSIVIELSGSNLPSGQVGLMMLVDSFSFAVSFSSSTFGRSVVIELGVNNSLAFGSEYKITRLEDSNQQTIQISEATITTPPKPSQLSLCVCGNEERTGMDLSGADAESCNTLKSAWNTATSLGILDTTMRIVDSADLSSCLIVTHRVPFNLISFQMEPATLRASPSSSQQTSTLVSVEEGGLCRLSFLAITADLSVSTFTLVSASQGTVVIRSCSIEGTRPNEMNSEDESICGWSRGLIELIETDTELNGVTMKEIVVGGIWMKGGKLKVTAGVFSQNGPSIADFPSARRNIHCEGDGLITIQSLSEGDGTKNSPSAWLDVSECTIEGDEDIARSPLFVPTLNSTESTAETDKSGKQTLKVVGKTLMPCGLWLEVFEWDSSQSVEGKSALVDLSTSTATHWNETEIIIPFSESDVTELNRKMEWRGRLVFGNGLRTSNWMVVSGLSSGNKSLGGTESNWWIAVIISLSCGLLVSVMIVVCVCLRRKRHSSRNELLKNEEMSSGGEVEEDEKMEEHDSITDAQNSAITSLPSAKEKQGSSFGETRFGSEEVIARGQSCVEVIVCNEKMERSVAVETDTLFNALHNGHSTRFVEKGKVGWGIARGLVRLVEMKVMADVLTRLSPHWVLFDTNDRVSLKMRDGQSVVLGESGIVSGGMKTSEDGQRWMAPEVLEENWKATLENADHGAVFSLGLVLWEIETGCVPFGEVDGATAQRRLASCEKPRMEKVSSSMEAIILPCLSLDPSQRPTLKTVLSQLDELNSVPEPSNKKEGNAMSHVG